MKYTFSLSRKSIFCAVFVMALVAFGVATPWKTRAQTTDNLTPGMLFGPLYVGDGQHLEICSSFLGEGTLTATIHFRNLSTGEVSANQPVTLPGGGGECAAYQGKGHVVGLARGDGAASDWVSPTNALISTMSVVDDNGTTQASVLGTAKIWVRGF